jgi:hypothetical protein
LVHRRRRRLSNFSALAAAAAALKLKIFWCIRGGGSKFLSTFFKNFQSSEKFCNRKGKNDNIERSYSELD